METLMLMLGVGARGDGVQEVLDLKYRTANYCLPEAPTRTVTTPFVGEALLDLYPGRFGAVHLFGTRDSMWHTLYRHAAGREMRQDQEELFFRLADGVESRSLEEHTGDWRGMEALLSERFGLPVTAHLMPLPHTEDGIWTMLKTMASAQIRDGVVSIDITHGLRVHPVFLLVTLFYLRSLRPGLRVGSVFYGALDLQGTFGGAAPVLDLKPIVALMDWVEAAKAFDRYGDAGPVAALLRQADGDGLEKTARRIEYLSRVLELNLLGDLGLNTRKLVKEVGHVDDSRLVPLALVRDRLLAFPREIAGEPVEWMRFLKTARYHMDHRRAGLATLAAWEALIRRLADVYHIGEIPYEMHRRLGGIARGDRDIRYTSYPDHLRAFNHRVRRLNHIRNAVAHADQETSRRIQPGPVYDQLPGLIAYLETTLPDPWLERMPVYYPVAPSS
ncbi:MAG: TIGR02221 family CRISPR-associated protein [Bacteroidetes bacterium]|nr:MAG: TIGR02221 family CRISPR-associated protein [Bacteroidota bacterium]